MKLLPPRELNTKLNEQKKSEADAGLFLAKKVDALREQLADEEQAHTAALQEMAREYDSAFGEYTAKKGALNTEIAYLEAKRETLLVPLDAEWKKVNELIAKTDEKAEYLDRKEAELYDREKGIVKREYETKKLAVRAEDTLSEAERIKKEAEKLYLKHEEEVIKLENDRFNYNETSKNILESITQKERKLTYDIQHYKDFESRLKRKEAELNIRETRLSIKELK